MKSIYKSGTMQNKKFSETYFSSYGEYRKRSSFLVRLIYTLKKFINYEKLRLEHNKEINKFYWKFFRDCKEVADFGAGEGYFLQSVPFGVRAIGVEISKHFVELNKSKGNECVLGDVTKTRLKSNSVDGVYSSHVIEHVKEPLLMVKEIHRVLKKGGIAVVRTPNFTKAYKNFYDDYTHVSPFTKCSLFRIFADNDFEVIKVSNGLHYSDLFYIFFLTPRLRAWFMRLFSFLSTEIYVVARKI